MMSNLTSVLRETMARMPYWIFWNMFLIFYFLICRIILVLSVHAPFAEVLFTGLRFDLLVAGFFLLLAFLFSFVLTLLRHFRFKNDFSRVSALVIFMRFMRDYKTRFFRKSWWGSCLFVLLCCLCLLDHLFYLSWQRRFTIYDVLEKGSAAFKFEFMTSSSFVAVATFSFLMMILYYFLFLKLKLKSADRFCEQRILKLTRKQTYGATVVFLFLCSLMARGTITPHHLRREHSYITSRADWNEIILNPLWSFDKER